MQNMMGVAYLMKMIHHISKCLQFRRAAHATCERAERVFKIRTPEHNITVFSEYTGVTNNKLQNKLNSMIHYGAE